MDYVTAARKLITSVRWVSFYMTVICFFSMIENSHQSTDVYLENNCGLTYTVNSYDLYKVYIEGSSAVSLSCKLTFKSWSGKDLTYQVRSLYFQSIDATLIIRTKSSLNGYTTTKGSYTFDNAPSTGEMTGEKYLELTLYRLFGSQYSAHIDVWIEDDLDLASPFTLTRWVIGCIAGAGVTFVVVVALIILCVCKNKAGRRGRVMAHGGAHPNGLHVTTTTTTIGAYGQTAQYVNPAFAPPPTYQQMYPGVAAPPPQYNTLPPPPQYNTLPPHTEATPPAPLPAQPTAPNQPSRSSVMNAPAYPPSAPPAYTGKY